MKSDCALGIDLGGTNIKLALVNRQGEALIKHTLTTRNYPAKKDLIAAVINKVETIMSDQVGTKRNILGMGIGVPGPVDSRKGIVHYCVNIKGWKNVPLAAIMNRHFKIPVFVDNDVNAATLAELKFGAGRGVENLVCLTLGTGVGGGVIVNGELYRGSTLCAGEIGHVPIERYGLKCLCGGYGCVERYVGSKYIVNNVKSQIRTGKRTIITKLVNNQLSEITPKVIAAAAKQGDRFAAEIWKSAGESLGIALAGIVNFFNPEKIIIGGGLAQAGPFLFDSIVKTVKLRAMKLPAQKVKIVRAKLGENAGVIGAAVLVMVNKKNVGAIPCNRPIKNNNDKIIKNDKNHIITDENMVSSLRYNHRAQNSPLK